jgi:hypothetical protein
MMSALSARSSELEAHAFAALEQAYNLEKIAGARIARWTQHSHQAFGGNVSRCGEVGKAHSCVDVIAQDDLRSGYIADEHRFDSFPEKCSSKSGITLGASADGFLEVASERHGGASYFLRL